MGKKDPRVDKYIDDAAEFAKPILTHLRGLVHKACPEVEETMKWSFPHFEYKGLMCDMAAFKNHCAFGFWKATLMKDKKLMENAKSETAMGHFGKITSLKDLPSDKILLGYIKEAKKLNDENVKLPPKKIEKSSKEITTPADFLKELKKNKTALKNFETFSPSHKKEYIQWIEEAKREETRKSRIATSISWLSEGKARNWKYMK